MSKKEKEKEAPAAIDPEVERVAKTLALPKEPPAEIGVEPERATTPAEIPIRKRKPVVPSGAYIVTEACGELRHDGKTYHAGDAVPLSLEEAQKLPAGTLEQME